MNTKNKLLIIFILVLSFIFFLRYNTNHLNVRENSKKELFFSEKIQNNTTFDVIFMGDSRTYHAINPETFKNTFPHKSIKNLALPSAILSQDYFDFINKKLNPQSSIFISITPLSLTHYDNNQILHTHLKYFKNYSFLAPYLLVLERLSSPLNVINILKGTQDFWRFPTEETLYHQNGWAEFQGKTINQSAADNYYGTMKEYKVDPLLIGNLLTQIKVWNHQGHKVFAYYIKGSDELTQFETEKQNTLFDLIEIENLCKEAGAHWINIKGSYETFDGDHYGTKEAKRFSSNLNNSIK